MRKLKSLVKTFAFTELEKECEKQDWRLPTLEEAKELDTVHDEFWIQPEVPVYNEYDAVYYSKPRNAVGYMNKTHRLTTAVVTLPKLCVDCNKYLGDQTCGKYFFIIPVPAEEFGCTTGFERVKI